MHISKYYPSRCANGECAFPNITCNECLSNRTKKGTTAVIINDPHGLYAWVRSF